MEKLTSSRLFCFCRLVLTVEYPVAEAAASLLAFDGCCSPNLGLGIFEAGLFSNGMAPLPCPLCGVPRRVCPGADISTYFSSQLVVLLCGKGGFKREKEVVSFRLVYFEHTKQNFLIAELLPSFPPSALSHKLSEILKMHHSRSTQYHHQSKIRILVSYYWSSPIEDQPCQYGQETSVQVCHFHPFQMSSD